MPAAPRFAAAWNRRFPPGWAPFSLRGAAGQMSRGGAPAPHLPSQLFLGLRPGPSSLLRGVRWHPRNGKDEPEAPG